MTEINTPFKRTEHGNKLAENAAYKLLIYWLDGNRRTFYSREWNGGRRVMTDEAALSRLRKYVYSKKVSVETALIYDNQTGVELYKFREGRWN